MIRTASRYEETSDNRSGTLAALALTLLLCRPASADEPAVNKVEQLRLEGKACYMKRDYRCALEKFQAAFALQPSLDMRFNIASARDKLGQYALAIRQYQQYLKQAGMRTPSKAFMHIQRRLKLLLPRVARLRLTLDPPKAQVVVDQETIDLSSCRVDATLQSPCEIVVDPGAHRLVVTAKDFTPFTQGLTIPAGQIQALAVVLTPLPEAEPCVLSVQSTPSGARLWIDGQPYEETTPLEINDLEPGQHALKIATRTRRFEMTIQIEEGRRTEVHATLQPIRVSIKITSEPPGAQVRLNERVVGTTPVIIPEVSVGRYRLFVDKPGHHSAQRQIQIDDSAPTPLTVHQVLRPLAPPPPVAHHERLSRPLAGGVLALESAALPRTITLYMDLAQSESTAYTVGIEGRYSFGDRIQLGLDFPVVTHGLFLIAADQKEQSALGDLRLLAKFKLAGESKGKVVVAQYLSGTLPTTSLALPSRLYTVLRSGVALTVGLDALTVGGDLAAQLELNEGDDWFLLAANTYGAVQITSWLDLQLGIQVVPVLKPRIDAPALGFFPVISFSPAEALSLSAGVRIAANDAARHLLCRGASRVLLLTNLGFFY